ncbi:MAG: hypothetical protein K2X44_12020 [Magnetospirillum sp.]|nr:hypothetical protein [Magnetospirillum sp.]
MKYLAFLASILLALPAIAAERCEGRYLAATEMVDAAIGRYDTLYSGGVHWHQLDHIGATLDLYRLWRGRPDLGLRRLYLHDDAFDGHLEESSVGKLIAEAIDLVESDQAGTASPSEHIEAATLLDLATSVSLPADWWRAPDGAANLSDVQRTVAHLATESPLLDWLQTAIAASDTPWSLAWHLDDGRADHNAEYERLITDALHKFKAGRGIEWAVAAQLFWHSGTVHEDELLQIGKDLEGKILKCEASPAEYAAYAAGASVAGRYTGIVSDRDRMAALPPSVQSVLARNTAMQIMARGSVADAPEALNALSGIALEKGFQPWLNVARNYTATSVEQLIEIHRGQDLDPKSVRVLNLLTVDNLQRLAQSGAISGETEVNLLEGTFARLFALGRVDEARGLLPRLREKLVASGSRKTIGAVEPSLPNDVAMALVVSRTPGLSTWIRGGTAFGYRYTDVGLNLFNTSHNRELPKEFGDGRAIQGDFETWLLLPQKWYRFYSMRGLTWDAMERNYANQKRRQRGTESLPAPAIFNSQPNHPSFGIARLAAFDEITLLQGDRRLIRQVSLTLLRWADAASDTWLKNLLSNRDLVAEALHRVVMLNRYDSGGDIDGVPLGKRAFKLLHKRFPKSEWAKKTPHWYNGRHLDS